MSRLFAVMRSAPEIAAWFGAEAPTGLVVPTETVEGAAGLVVIEREGRRHLRAMQWGFPRLTREMQLRGDPPGRIGLVADLTNPMWEHLVVEPRYRCLIPLTHFANPDGVAGAKTRTWFSLNDAPMTAWAGFCRNTPEFGPVFAGMTMTANAAVEPYNDRMPVLLDRADFTRWLHGGIEDVIAFQFGTPIAADRLAILATEDRWRSGKPPPVAAGAPQIALDL